jgi:hypothetical protein
MGQKDGLMPPWEKGQSGNPKGRPKKIVSSVLKDLEDRGCEKVTKAYVKGVYEYLIGLSEKDLEALERDKDIPIVYKLIAKNVLGDRGFDILEKMLDRIHGKAMQQQTLEVSGKDGAELPPMTLIAHMGKPKELDNKSKTADKGD